MVGFLVVTFWAAMTGWLLRREVLPAHRGTAAPPAPTEPRERWYGVFAEGGRLGVVHLVERPEMRGTTEGSTVQLTAALSLTLAGSPERVQLAGSLWRPLAEGSVELAASLVSGEHRLELAGTIRDGVLDAVVTSAGEAVPLRTRVDEDLFAAGGLSPLGGAVPPLAPGEEVLLPGFDPLTLQPTRVRVRRPRAGEAQPDGPPGTAQVLLVTSGSSTITVWTDTEGEILEATTPFGVRLRRLSRQEALAGDQAPAAPDLLAGTLVTPKDRRPMRGARRMVVRLEGVGQPLPEDDTQLRLRPGIYRVQPQRPLPMGQQPPLLRRYLEPEPLVQSDHPRLRAAAAAAVAGATDLWDKAQRLNRWVHENVAKETVVSLPSALDVLASREGDCNEHTVLFTALARAAGVPCRMAVGLVWSEELEAFGYHAWPEVWVGRWVWLDPTLGQEVADATHLKLVEGGLERWGQVLAYLGQLQVEVLEVE